MHLLWIQHIVIGIRVYPDIPVRMGVLLFTCKTFFCFNPCTALLKYHCCAAVLFNLQQIQTQCYCRALMLAFTPVFYIQSTNAMDYNWSLCFLLASLYFAGRRNIFLAALTLVLATGCRITAILFILPLYLSL